MIFILIGIALFGYLMFSLTRGSNTSTSLMSKGTTKSTAEDMLEFSRTVAGGVQKVISKGCSENEISFENSITTGYANANSPSSGDRHCWVFDPAGGNINPRLKASGTPVAGFFGVDNISGIGTTAPDLIVKLTVNDAATCYALNGNKNTLALGWSHSGNFIGTYTDPGAILSVSTASLHKSRTSLCYQYVSDPTKYYYYYVLLAR